MSKIHVLSEHLANMIAAGEVVERPANIVKECVENAIDAGAGQIDIEVFEGGIEKIIITDDGRGMDFYDAKLAFLRHATSKLKEEEDLFNIQSMGFRGEALPSIAAVAKVDLQTNDSNESSHIVYEYGENTVSEKSACPRGTKIEISGLFIKTPARFKYLRKANYEFSVIADLVNKLAISYPNIRFTLFHNQRKVFQTSGNGDIKEIIYRLYGKDVYQNAEEIQARNEDFSISGFAVQPKINRASKYFIFISINHRLVRSVSIQNAILEGYREFLPPNRYPIVILDIETDTQLVDVNVHPNKWEVRITKQADLASLIKEEIEKLFSKKLETVEAKEDKEQVQKPVFEQAYLIDEPEDEMEEKPKGIFNHPKGIIQSSEKSYENPNQKENSFVNEERFFQNLKGHPDLKDYSKNNHVDFDAFKKDHQIQKVQEDFDRKVTFKVNETDLKYPVPVKKEINESERGKEFFKNLRIIGQLKKSYILCENDSGLVIIDQHAAQERYNFERIENKLKNQPIHLQPLMLPIILPVSPKIISEMEAINQMCQDFGIVFEAFGDDRLIVRQIPDWMLNTDEKKMLEDIIDYYMDHEKVDIPHLMRHISATAACHSSIRFNRSLTKEEMFQVLLDLQKCEQPYHCPHGRPTVITIKDKELRKEFERG